MTFELAISTMHKTLKEVFEMLDIMNIHCNCLIINQCDRNDYYEGYRNLQKIRVIFTKERGLSKSRNMAINNAQADILGITDDDLYYYDDFDETVLTQYESNPNADIIIFNIDDCYKKFSLKLHYCSFLELSGYKSIQCTFKVQAIKNRNLRFNEFFGTGSGYFNSGEENIFLADAWRKKLRILYCSKKILRRDKAESSWFKGFNDPVFISNRGAVYYKISRLFFLLYILRFALKYRVDYKPYTFFQALGLMLDGRRQCIEICKG